MNREEWLSMLVDLLRPYFPQELQIPEKVAVSCGWPSTRALSSSNRRIGECWWSSAAKDGIHQIFISPWLGEGIAAAETLVHELVHAALPDGEGHRGNFPKMAKLVGLIGKPTSTSAGPALREKLEELIEQIGPYPNPGLSALDKHTGPKKQTTRMLKAFCPPNEEHKKEYIVRVAKSTVNDYGAPVCPCGKELEIEDPKQEDAQ